MKQDQKSIIQEHILDMTVAEFKEALSTEWMDGKAERVVDAMVEDLADALCSTIVRFGGE